MHYLLFGAVCLLAAADAYSCTFAFSAQRTTNNYKQLSEIRLYVCGVEIAPTSATADRGTNGWNQNPPQAIDVRAHPPRHTPLIHASLPSRPSLAHAPASSAACLGSYPACK